MKKRLLLLKIATLALALAPRIVATDSWFWIGQPELPKCMKD